MVAVETNKPVIKNPVSPSVAGAKLPADLSAEKKKKRKGKGITSKAKKKKAVARAVIRKGTGIVRINKRNLETFEPKYLHSFVKEPLDLAESLSAEVDIDIHVEGGGFMGQAVSARAAIAKALVKYSSNDKLRQKFLKYDRLLLVDDPRRVETKKPLGVKARRKKQKSKR